MAKKEFIDKLGIYLNNQRIVTEDIDEFNSGMGIPDAKYVVSPMFNSSSLNNDIIKEVNAEKSTLIKEAEEKTLEEENAKTAQAEEEHKSYKEAAATIAEQINKTEAEVKKTSTVETLTKEELEAAGLVNEMPSAEIESKEVEQNSVETNELNNDSAGPNYEAKQETEAAEISKPVVEPVINKDGSSVVSGNSLQDEIARMKAEMGIGELAPVIESTTVENSDATKTDQ